MTEALFDMEPAGRRRREVGAMPGDTVQPSLFGDAGRVLARKHPTRTVEPATDATPVMFATDEREWAGQTATVDIFGGAQ